MLICDIGLYKQINVSDGDLCWETVYFVWVSAWQLWTVMT